MDESVTNKNRRSRRSHLLLTATLDYSGRAVKVTVRNLSSDGAQVEGAQLPVEGSDLMFRKGDLAVAGSVIWVKGKQAGIRFDQELDPATVLNHVPAARPRKSADFRRPGLGSRALTDQERALAETWIALGPVPTANR